MPDALSALIRLFFIQWNGVPVASLAVFIIGRLMHLAMSRSPTTATTPREHWPYVDLVGLHDVVRAPALAIRPAAWVSGTRRRPGACI